MDSVDDLLPVVDVVLQAGPPAYMVAAFGGVVALLVCAPLAILGALLLIALVVSASVVALAGAVLVMPVMLVRRTARHLARPARVTGPLSSWRRTDDRARLRDARLAPQHQSPAR